MRITNEFFLRGILRSSRIRSSVALGDAKIYAESAKVEAFHA